MGNIIQGRNLKFISSHFGEYKKPKKENEFRIGSVKEVTHDGDTVKISAHGNFSVRFLGIDTPEISFEIKDDGLFHHTNSQIWIDYLENIQTQWNTIREDLSEDLYNHLSERFLQGNLAINHNIHAKRAEDKLEEFIQADIDLLGLNNESMKLFLPFSYEILDTYGRLLSFVHPDLKNPEISEPPAHMESYNFKMLESGYSLPYFIWPNINPFRKEESVSKAAYNSPDEFREKMKNDNSLKKARTAVKNARCEEKGVFENAFTFEGTTCKRLLLEAFELRFLSRQLPPSRYFIDFSSTSNQILKPTDYFRCLPEDRLFIPSEYIPLFEKRGWVVLGEENPFC